MRDRIRISFGNTMMSLGDMSEFDLGIANEFKNSARVHSRLFSSYREDNETSGFSSRSRRQRDSIFRNRKEILLLDIEISETMSFLKRIERDSLLYTETRETLSSLQSKTLSSMQKIERLLFVSEYTINPSMYRKETDSLFALVFFNWGLFHYSLFTIERMQRYSILDM